MATNFEHIIKSSPQDLSKTLARAAALSNDKGYCEDTILRWLVAEHIEPNTWESLLEDLERAYNDDGPTVACDYFEPHGDCVTCEVEKRMQEQGQRMPCNKVMVIDIIDRIRFLLEKDSKVK